MPEPFPRDEDRAADVEAERVVLERRAVAIAHQEADQALVGGIHLVLVPSEGDARAVDDGEVVGHGIVEPHEAVVEDADRLLGTDVGRHGHGRRTLLRPSDVPYRHGNPDRHLGLVVSLMAARASTPTACSRRSSSATTQSGSTRSS